MSQHTATLSDDSLQNRSYPTVNRRIVLNSRPKGKPTADNFRMEEVPPADPQDGELSLQTLYLSLDPYMRSRMSDAPSYAPPVSLGDVMVGGTVSRVIVSGRKGYAPGDLVLSQSGWQTHSISNGTELIKLDARMPQPSLALGVLGMPGFTAYMGLLDIGQPRASETVVVAAASGAVGSVVGQIARIQGCRIVGIAGGPEKCRYVIEELGFDDCIDHREPTMVERLAGACPRGIDVYFESVGGAVFDAVLPLLNPKARIPLCGLIAHYNDKELPPGPDRLSLLTKTILTKRLKVQGFIIFEDYSDRYEEFFRQMSTWFNDGQIKFREDIVDGLQNAPEAFIGMLDGKNFGKLIVRVAGEDR